jgi:hypothetical protein
MAPQPITEDWLSTDEAARRLKTTVRTVERYIKEQRVGSAKKRCPGRKPMTLVDPDDVARLVAEQNKGAVLAPETLREHTGAQVTLINSVPAMVQRIADAIENTRPPRVPPFMMLEEAARYSGLPEGLLMKFIRAGQLPAVSYGHKRNTWVKTADLDDFELPCCDNSRTGRNVSEQVL